MKVLSLFDGISCARVALERSGIKVSEYFASEVDKYAMKVSAFNYPDIKQLGDVRNVTGGGLPLIDIVVGGSPCQGFSFAGLQLNFEDPRSKLFFEYTRILKEIKERNPNVKFLLENVKMRKACQDVITQYMGVEPIEINSSIFSAQKRKRLYWTNIPQLALPPDKGLLLKDIVEDGGEYFGGAIRGRYNAEGKTEQTFESNGTEKSNALTTVRKDAVIFKYLNEKQIERAKINHSAKTWKSGNKMGSVKFPTPLDGKSKCLTTMRIAGGRESNHIQDEIGIRLLTAKEYERLQTLPDDYTASAPESYRFKMIGNGWNVDTICHLIQGLNN